MTKKMQQIRAKEGYEKNAKNTCKTGVRKNMLGFPGEVVTP